MNDIHNAYDTLDRALKKIGIQLVDEQHDLKNGNPAQYIALMRKLLIGTSTIIAKQLLGRGCPSHANDKKFVITAFDILRDSKQAPNISVEQFFNATGFVFHKLVVLTRLAEYVYKYAGIKPGTMTPYVVIPDNAPGSIFDGSDLMSPEFLRSAAYSSRKTTSPIPMDSSVSDWPLSDFIRQHIDEHKNADTMTREKFKKNIIRSRTLANMAYVAEENIITHAIAGGNSGGSAYNSPLPSGKKKVVRSVSAGRTRGGVNSSNSQTEGDDENSLLIQTNSESMRGQSSPQSSGYSSEYATTSPVPSSNSGVNGNDQLYSLLRSPAALSGKSPKPVDTPKRSSSIPKSRPRKSTSGSEADDGPFGSPPPLYPRDSLGNPIKKDSNGHDAANGNGSKASQDAIKETDELVKYLSEKYENKLIEKLEYDFHKKMEEKLEELIDAKVAAAVKDVTERYDFIINKLVAAVDSEFALLNNQLKMATGGKKV